MVEVTVSHEEAYGLQAQRAIHEGRDRVVMPGDVGAIDVLYESMSTVTLWTKLCYSFPLQYSAGSTRRLRIARMHVKRLGVEWLARREKVSVGNSKASVGIS